MLKALELVGFKSFADKTRFEFPRGITVVVGPNGSGKSNVVDAIKWVLGEQSVKSLRGKEMSDCIFNGSASRRALNAAEVTLSFDNSERLLAVDTPEVQITRRVYRSGEGEYLINRQPCRLRDIRDLLAGTGAATEAYGVIEQGKVDVLLQSSPKDRRLIFEEAAGISRFKAKKIEAQRRLERVEQNLLRLSDIVEEVESRLRGVRLQAGKARRYREYADRLQELRTQVGLADWRALSEKLAAHEAELQTARDEIGAASAQADLLEAQSLELDLQIAGAEQLMRTSESRIAHNRERIAMLESSIEHERRRSRDLEEEVARHRRQSHALSTRAVNLDQQLHVASDSLEELEVRGRLLVQELEQAEKELAALVAHLEAARAENELRRTSHLEQLRTAGTLGNQISVLDAQLSAARSLCERGSLQMAELAIAHESAATDLTALEAKLAELAHLTGDRQRQLLGVRNSLSRNRHEHAQRQRDLAQLRERLSGASQRAAVLEELEKQLEGLNAGVREVLVQAREQKTGVWKHVRGLVADLLHVNMESAGLVEVALGETAQHLVVDQSADLIAFLQRDAPRFAGRVGFVRMDLLTSNQAAGAIDLQGQPGVLGRADRFVETSPEFTELAQRLLGNTWIVEKLSHAIALSASSGRGHNFVTLAEELLTADGLLAVGPRHAATGLISRRSELRALRREITQLNSQVEQAQQQASQSARQIATSEAEEQRLALEHQESNLKLGEQRLQTSAARQRQQQLAEQAAALAAQISAAEVEQAAAHTTLEGVRGELAQTESRLAELEGQLVQGSASAEQLELVWQRQSQKAGAARVELARHEQRLDHLKMLKDSLQRDQQERGRALGESRIQLASCLERARIADRNILRAEGELAELYLGKEGFFGETMAQFAGRERLREQKTGSLADAQRIRAKVRKLETRLHAKELAAGEARHERASLEDRLREDYQIELAEIEHQPSAEELHHRESVEQEIAELRAKINSIGGVNLDALTELDELEARFASLSSQHADLSSAKGSLDTIIGKINADSRRLFAETLELVRGHFQALFRKLFGGGQADIVLEEGADILECGIEIIARPPGKEPRNISLLSGGEKTLTCVALLLAVFRSRPSPFCVLDEVDAALDEANIERFIAVLNEFLAWTQFIVVTHSKKTMTCASTLYGVTMQESGVSKRVSVRFEDVSEDGQIKTFQDEPSVPASDETQAA